MKLIDLALLNHTSHEAKQSPRLRMNYNFHSHPEDPINRLLNAMEPGSYIRPHRHSSGAKNEILLVLRGKIAVFLFDNNGTIEAKEVIAPTLGVYGTEFRTDRWHGLLVLEPNTVLYEIKQGPFVPLLPVDMAPWSPAVENVEEVRRYLCFLQSQVSI